MLGVSDDTRGVFGRCLECVLDSERATVCPSPAKMAPSAGQRAPGFVGLLRIQRFGQRLRAHGLAQLGATQPRAAATARCSRASSFSVRAWPVRRSTQVCVEPAVLRCRGIARRLLCFRPLMTVTRQTGIGAFGVILGSGLTSILLQQNPSQWFVVPQAADVKSGQPCATAVPTSPSPGLTCPQLQSRAPCESAGVV